MKDSNIPLKLFNFSLLDEEDLNNQFNKSVHKLYIKTYDELLCYVQAWYIKFKEVFDEKNTNLVAILISIYINNLFKINERGEIYKLTDQNSSGIIFLRKKIGEIIHNNCEVDFLKAITTPSQIEMQDSIFLKHIPVDPLKKCDVKDIYDFKYQHYDLCKTYINIINYLVEHFTEF